MPDEIKKLTLRVTPAQHTQLELLQGHFKVNTLSQAIIFAATGYTDLDYRNHKQHERIQDLAGALRSIQALTQDIQQSKTRLQNLLDDCKL